MPKWSKGAPLMLPHTNSKSNSNWIVDLNVNTKQQRFKKEA